MERITVYPDKKLKARLEKEAKRQRRSLNNLILLLLDHAVKRSGQSVADQAAAPVASSLDVDEIKAKLVRVLKKHGVVKAGIFGSYARGEAREDSDVDVLIEVKARKFSLLDLVALERELERILKRKVVVIIGLK